MSPEGWGLAALVLFAFLAGVRVCYMLTVETRVLKKRADENDRTDKRQQKDIDLALKRVNDLLHSKNVKRITIKRRKK